MAASSIGSRRARPTNPGTFHRVGYLVNAYPVASETFLVSELRGIEREGITVTLLPLSDRHDPVTPAGTDRVRADVIRPEALLPLGWLRALRSHLDVLAGRPMAYLRLIRDDVIRPSLRSVVRPLSRRSWKLLRKRWRLFWLAPILADRARKANVGHLHAHYSKAPLEIAARLSWLVGLPYSFAAHAKDLYTTPGDRLARRLAKAKFALACHPHGERTLRELAETEEDRNKVHLIPHGLDLSVFKPGSVPREKGLIVAAGRLTPKKGFDVLVDACSRLRRRCEFRCVILGEGRLRERLEERIRRRGLGGWVSVREFVDQRELASWFRRAQVVAVPARVLKSGNRDGVPNVLLEAMACGAPVVATPVGSIGELVEDRVTARLVPPEDPKALAAALAKTLAAPVRAQKMAERARLHVQGLDFRKAGKQIAKLFHHRLVRVDEQRDIRPLLSMVDYDRMVRLAERRLGRKPRLEPEVEEAIALSIAPGVRANSWRPDVARMAERRLWDEVVKASKARELWRLARSRGILLDSSRRVLDVGCGRGGLSAALMARGVETVSLDLRLRNCHVARLRGRRYDHDVPAVSGRAEELPFADNAFDVVCLFEVLEHVEQPTRLLAEARRVCHPEGLSVVTVVNRWAHLDPHYRLWGINFLPRPVAERIISVLGRSKESWRDNQRLADMHYYSYSAFARFAQQTGFRVHDPRRPQNRFERFGHQLERRTSLGFNTITLLLEPT